MKLFEILTCATHADNSSGRNRVAAAYTYAVLRTENLQLQNDSIEDSASAAPFVARYSALTDEISYTVAPDVFTEEEIALLKAHYSKEHVQDDGSVLTAEFVIDREHYPEGLGKCTHGTIVYYGDIDWIA